MKKPHWTDEAKWIWLANYDDTSATGQVVLFRKTFHLQSKPKNPVLLRVSADTRYRLFVNNVSVSFGPCKSYLSRWYYDTIDISPHLREGHNIFHARVLRFSNVHAGSLSLIRAPSPGFILHCAIDEQILHTTTTWEVRMDPSVEMISRSEWNYALGPPFLAMNERVNATRIESDWESSSTDLWSAAQIVSTKSMMLPVLEPWKLTERSIPALPETERSFKSAVTCNSSIPLNSWNNLLQGKSSLQIPAKETIVVEIQTAELTTGFLTLKCLAGAGATIKLLCAECYEKPMERCGPGAKRSKGDRTDYLHGKLYGPEDHYITRNGANLLEPFWFRTFRYVQLTVSTQDEPMILQSFSYRETHYPLDIQSSMSASSELEQMWKISLNTLRNCMHETYEDCPYYEQNQFAMDSRIQMLFTYQLSRDDRLARKCMQEFYASRRDDGLLEAHFPSPGRCVQIPQFSLFWVLMVHDHMRYFDDRRLIKQYIGTIDGILDHFDTRINESGLVGQFDEESWPFIDWVKEWHNPQKGLHGMGIPQAYWEGAATYNSLVYAFALNHAADLCDFIGRHDTANQYRDRAAALNFAVNQQCFDGDFYLDGPGSRTRSQHPQVFAILSGAIKGAAAAELMRKTLEDSSLAQCSYAMSFYLLRAADIAGVYQDMFPRLIEPWRKMMANKLTTWAEDDVSHRSDCHGWSASPLFETIVQLFGLSPNEHGYKSLRLKPSIDLLPRGAEGTFVTAGGHVKISWTMEESFVVQATYDCTVEFVHKGSLQSHILRKDVPLCLLAKEMLSSPDHNFVDVRSVPQIGVQAG